MIYAYVLAYLREPHWDRKASPFGLYGTLPPGIQSVNVASISFL